MSDNKPVGGKILTKPFIFLSILAMVAGILLLKRFLFGLGSVTNLNDGYPWGLWIVYDVLIGTALACGGYAIAILVYIFNKGKYHPLVRPALLTSMFGYTLAGAAIVVDVGRYWNLINLFRPKYSNLNSIMVEVAICVATYVIVLWMEFSPTFFEKLKAKKPLGWMNRTMFVFIGLGVLLPTMHQSSLGSLMIIAGYKVYPLWQTNWLPLLFLMSALSMGYGMVIFESLFSSVTFKRPIETEMLSKVSAIVGRLLALFLILKFGDIAWRGQLGLIFRGDINSIMFLLEILLFLYPTVMFLSPKLRVKPRILFISGASILLAGALYRFNTFLIGFNPGAEWQYFPSFSEIMITVGIIAFEIMAYLVFVKTLPVLPHLKPEKNLI